MTESKVVHTREPSIRRGGPQLLVVLTVVVLAQSTRLLFPIMFEIGEDWDFLLAGLVALGAFSAPLLVAAMPPLSPSTALMGGAGMMAGGLISARLLDPIPAPLAILVVVGSLVSVTLMLPEPTSGRC